MPEKRPIDTVDPDPVPRQQRRQKILRLAIAAPVLVILAVIGIAAIHHFWPFTQDQIAASLENAFSGNVAFEHFHTTYFPHPGCVAEGVVFNRKSRKPGPPPFATVQRLTIQAHYLDVLLRPGVVAFARLEGLHVQVPPRGSIPEGEASKTESSTRIGEVVADSAVVDILRTGGTPLRFEIHTAKLTEVTHDASFSYDVTFHNPLPPGEIQSQGKFGPWRYDDPDQTPVEGKYKFTGADLSVFPAVSGMLSSDDEFRGVLGRIDINGSLVVPDFEVDRSGNQVPLRSTFQALVNGTNGDIELEKVETNVAQTLVFANGRIAGVRGRQGKTASFNFRVNQGRIQDLLRLLVHAPKAPLNGTITLSAKIVVPPDDKPFLRRLQVDGDFRIEGGRFTTADTQSQIADLSHRGQGEKPKGAADEDPADTISKLWGRASARNGIATLTDFYFEVPGAKAKLNGTYGLVDQKLNFHGKLGTDVKISQATEGFKSVLLKPFDGLFKGRRHPGVVPVKLVGTYSQPKAGLDMVK